jgi:hypothetical protein
MSHLIETKKKLNLLKIKTKRNRAKNKNKKNLNRIAKLNLPVKWKK